MFKLFKKDHTPDQLEITISTPTVLRVVGLVLGAIILLAAVKQASNALILIFTAFFLALALNAPVYWISRHLPGSLYGKRSVATAISFLGIVIFLAAFLASIVPPLVKQTESFINNVPSIVADARDRDSEIGKLVSRYHLEGQLDNASGEISDKLRSASGSLISGVGKIGSSIFNILTILVLTFMMIIEGPRIVAFVRELVPKMKRKDADRIAQDMYAVVKGFINGQVTLAALAAVLITPAFFILDISYPIALMVIVFICGLIPMVGHLIGAAIVTLVALAVSPVSALIILGYYILYQQIENLIIQPRIQANSTNMSPLLVFVSVVTGVSFGGLFGGLFAIPIAGCIRILVLEYLVNHEYITDAPVIEDTAKQATT